MRDEPKTILSILKNGEPIEVKENDSPGGKVFHVVTVGDPGKTYCSLYFFRQSDGTFILHYSGASYCEESPEFVKLSRMIRKTDRDWVTSESAYNFLIKLLGKGHIAMILNILSAQKT